MTYQPKQSIVLVGLMGVGKTTIGRKLSTRLSLPFYDLDSMVEDNQGCSVAEIFEYGGEEVFRGLEKRILGELLLSGGVKVISTGGGAFMFPENREVIAQNAISVWLNARLSTLVERTSKRNTRPLLETGDKAEILKKLIEERTPIYSKADFMADTDLEPNPKVVDNIIQKLPKYDR